MTRTQHQLPFALKDVVLTRMEALLVAQKTGIAKNSNAGMAYIRPGALPKQWFQKKLS